MTPTQSALLSFVQARAKEQHQAALAEAHSASSISRQLDALKAANRAHEMRNDVLDCRHRGGDHIILIREHAANFSDHPDYRNEWRA